MDHNETSTFTPFDYMTQTRELQMLKTMLPYMKDTQKKQFAILIKYMELQNTVQVFSQEDKVMSMCSVDEGSNNMVAMLNDLRVFCTSKEQETIDMLANSYALRFFEQQSASRRYVSGEATVSHELCHSQKADRH